MGGDGVAGVGERWVLGVCWEESREMRRPSRARDLAGSGSARAQPPQSPQRTSSLRGLNAATRGESLLLLCLELFHPVPNGVHSPFSSLDTLVPPLDAPLQLLPRKRSLKRKRLVPQHLCLITR